MLITPVTRLAMSIEVKFDTCLCLLFTYTGNFWKLCIKLDAASETEYTRTWNRKYGHNIKL